MRADLKNYVRARLTRLGAISKTAGKLDAPSGRSLLEIWQAFEKRTDVEVGGPTFFDRYVKMRWNLGVSDLPHPEWVLAAYLKLYGAKGVRASRIKQILGHHSSNDAYLRLNALVSRSFKRVVRLPEATEEALYALLPEQTRSRFKAHLSRQLVPAIDPVDLHHIARVNRLEGSGLRLLAALALIDATGNRRAASTKKELIKNAEVQSAILSGLDQFDPAQVECALEARLDSGGSTATVMPSVRDWFRQHRAARAVATEVLGDEAWRVVDLLPAYAEPEGAVAVKLAEGLRLLKKPKSREGNEKAVVDIIARLIEVQAAAENRVYQLEQIFKAFRAARAGEQAEFAEGGVRGFEWTGQVVRADGSLGVGRQTVHFLIMTEGTLLARASKRGCSAALKESLPGGPRHRPERSGRLHLVYDRTEPEVPGGEWVEPFFVQLFRWGVFEPDRSQSDGANKIRMQLIATLGVPQFNCPSEGLLQHPRSRQLAAYHARGVDPQRGDIVIPLIELYHAMCYARIALRFGIRWGARIGETMQLRIGCIKLHDRDGVKDRPYVELKPKGWQVMGKFGMDPGTARAIAAVRTLSNARWFDCRLMENGNPWLPDRPALQANRSDLPDAAYLFQTATRVVLITEMSKFVRVLLLGVVDYRHHDGRRVFATALGLGGAGYEQIGMLLHHSPKSRMPARYDLSALIVEDDATARFNTAMDASEQGKVGNA